MKIAYITSIYPRATDTFVRTEVEILRQNGFDVHTFSARKTPDQHTKLEVLRNEINNTTYLLDGNTLKLLVATVVYFFRSPGKWFETLKMSWRSGKQGFKNRIRQIAYFLEACYFAQQLEAKKIDHIHNHTPMNSGVISMLASNLTEIPFSMTVHGPGIFFEPNNWGLGDMINRTSFTACITDFCRSQCMIFAPPECWDRLKIVHCGLKRDFLDTPFTPLPDKHRFVCIGRFCPEKGQVQVVEATKVLRDEGHNFEVVLVGDGDLRPQIEEKIEEYQLQDHVTLTGWMDSSEVREEILKSRALLMPSFAEGLPVTIMESLSLCRPVITTRIAGIPELVREGESGWITTAGSASELHEAMREALNCPTETMEAMGKNGRELVLEHHNAETEVAKLMRYFKGADEKDSKAQESSPHAPREENLTSTN